MLQATLAALPSEFTRAASAVHVDMATALAATGEAEAAYEHARQALRLAESTGSARQRARIEALLNPEGEQVQQRDQRA